MRGLVAGAAALALAVIFARNVPAVAADELVVCPTCPQHNLQEAIQTAAAGSVIRVRAGVYDGPIVIDRPLTLIGEEQPVIDGHGQGTVVHITAPTVQLEGFVVRGSGVNHDREDTGILVSAPQARVAGNHVLDCLFGIELLNAPDSIVENNTVVGKPLPEPQRGDGIKLWYSPHAQVIGNHVQDSRDVLIWYADGTVVAHNLVEQGRYGLHFMYSQESTITQNILRDNSVGLYLMYGANQVVRGNAFLHNRGPSGYGIALKETDGAVVEANLMAYNRVGLFLDNSPVSVTKSNHIAENWIAYNDIGFLASPATRNNVVARNTFLENLEQVSPQGGGTLTGITWQESGQGNFWSDYAGYDADRDGIGDIPYEPRALSSSLFDRSPMLAYFRFSFAALALDFAARAVPLFQPPPKLVDQAPLVAPTHWPNVPYHPPAPPRWHALAPLMLLPLGGLVIALGMRRRQLQPARATAWTASSQRPQSTTSTPHLASQYHSERTTHRHTALAPIITVNHLQKRFGDRAVLTDVTFEVLRGDAVALWGPNGAGKTTLLRCLLGHLAYEGTISIFGLSPLHNGPTVRARVGYVPQQLPLLDLTVSELVHTVARLRGEPLERAWERLGELGLQQAWHQSVHTLSGGMQQRLALVLATIGDPPLLLLDEPTANLDASTREQLLTTLIHLRDDGRTILFASHRLDDVARLATRVVRLENGHVVGETFPDQPLAASPLLVVLILQLDPEAIRPALHLLTAHGFTVHQHGDRLRVRVASDQKGEPFFLLAQIGIAVRDFQMEVSHG